MIDAPRCKTCRSPMQDGTARDSHILEISCLKEVGLRLEALEQAFALQRKENALRPGVESNPRSVDASHASADAPAVRLCGACGLEFTARRQWSTYCSPKCRMSAHLARRAAEATGSEQKT